MCLPPFPGSLLAPSKDWRAAQNQVQATHRARRKRAKTESVMTSLSLRGITKRFDSQEVLSGVSLDVAAGERVVLAGASGSGKTTLLRLIAGLEKPSSGSVVIDDCDVTAWAPNRRSVGLVFQDYATYPRLTVAENLSVGFLGTALSKGEKQARLDSMVQWLELEGLLPKLPTQLSGGQLQRVALGKALLLQPKILLLDEPFSQLDVRLAAQMRQLLDESDQRSRTTRLMVTHHPLDAQFAADKLAILENGRLVQFAPPAQVRARPATRFAAELTSLMGLNVFPSVAFPELSAPHDSTIAFRPESVHCLGEGEQPPGQNALGFSGSVIGIHELGGISLREIHIHGYRARALLAAGNGTASATPGINSEIRGFVAREDVMIFPNERLVADRGESGLTRSL